jgi:hypothetical protein
MLDEDNYKSFDFLFISPLRRQKAAFTTILVVKNAIISGKQSNRDELF